MVGCDVTVVMVGTCDADLVFKKAGGDSLPVLAVIWVVEKLVKPAVRKL